MAVKHYFHRFTTENEFYVRYNDSTYYEPWVSYTDENGGSAYNKGEEYTDIYTDMPFTIRALGSGNITWGLETKTVQYSKNGGAWTNMNSGTTISVVAGDEVQFKGTNTDYNGNKIVSTMNFDVMGNIMSLLNGDNFKNATTLPPNAFRSGLFYNKDKVAYGVVNAAKLKLPDFTSTYAYMNAFAYCYNLVSAPVLPAMILSDHCYAQMFSHCTSLTKIPALPATTLSTYCYQSMFYGCTSLVTAPELPAITMEERCYAQMFWECTNLVTAPELPATTIAAYCYYNMFYDCSNLINAPSSLPAMTMMDHCYAQMFYGCTSLITAPELPATTVATYCYYNMFYGCTNLTSGPSTLPATTVATYCYSQTFYNCSNLLNAPILPALTLQESSYFAMFYGCAKINYICCLATNISANSCTTSWVDGVASNGTFVKNPNMTSWTRGSNGIPSNWTVQETNQGAN